MSSIHLDKYRKPLAAVLILWWGFFVVLGIIVGVGMIQTAKTVGNAGYAISQFLSFFFIGTGIKVFLILNKSTSIRKGSYRVITKV